MRELLRPCKAGVGIVFVAMRVEKAMSLAAPWPLKIVIDNALGHHPLPEWLERVYALGIDRDTMGLALVAGIAVVIVALEGDRPGRRGPARDLAKRNE